MHLFAHNGGLEGIWDKKIVRSYSCHPTGETDSEFAFCLLLERLAPLGWTTEGHPPLQNRLEAVSEVAEDLRAFGPANFLYSDGDVLFVHSHKRHWDEGGGTFSRARPPGLSLALRSDLMVKVPDPDTTVVYIASVPLTEEGWSPLPEGTVLARAREGTEVARMEPGQ